MAEVTKAPFFIVGCPRSGTTLLQVLIEEHPRIAIPPESFLFLRFGPFFDAYGDLSAPANARRFAAELLDDERIRDWSLRLTAEELCAQAAAPTAPALVDALFAAFARGQGKERWGDKTPQHAMCLPLIARTFPGARIVHLVRDGRDVAESMARITIGPSSIYGIARRWDRFARAAKDFARVAPPGRFLEVRFEDLVRDPDSTRRTVFAFLGEDPGLCAPATREVPDTAARRQATSAARHHASLKGGITTGKIGVFRDRFTPRQIEIFEAVAGESLKAYGYELTVPRPRPPSAAERAGFALQDGVWRYVRKFLQPGAARQVGKEVRLEWQVRLRALRHSRFPGSPGPGKRMPDRKERATRGR